MTFDRKCESTFSTPLQVFAPLTRTTSGITTGSPSVVYQWRSISEMGDDEYLTVTTTNTTIVNTGLAWADPIVVGWQVKDLSLFPSAYAASLANRLNIPFTPLPGMTPGLPGQTSPPGPPSSGLSTGAKAGIGVGAVFGAASIIGVIFFLTCLLRRRRRQRIPVGTRGNELPEMMDQNKRREGSDS